MSEVVDIHKVRGKTPEFDVYIGRRVRYTDYKASKWANYKATLEEYEAHVRKDLIWDLWELVGKRLGCWCITTREISPVACHGQVLMKLIKEMINVEYKNKETNRSY